MDPDQAPHNTGLDQDPNWFSEKDNFEEKSVDAKKAWKITQ